MICSVCGFFSLWIFRQCGFRHGWRGNIALVLLGEWGSEECLWLRNLNFNHSTILWTVTVLWSQLAAAQLLLWSIVHTGWLISMDEAEGKRKTRSDIFQSDKLKQIKLTHFHLRSLQLTHAHLKRLHPETKDAKVTWYHVELSGYTHLKPGPKSKSWLQVDSVGRILNEKSSE